MNGGYRAGYIGGDLSFAEREPLLAKLRALPSVDLPRRQCRCGQVAYCRYRGRVYCPRCGRRPDSRSELVAEVSP